MSAECPRCGYDQSGIIDSWKEGCPLTGTCSECGLQIDWRDVLNPAYSVHLHLFEHAKAHVASAWWRTLSKTRMPGRFWRWMRLEYEIRSARLLGFGATATPAALLLASCLTALFYVVVAKSNTLNLPLADWRSTAENIRAGLLFSLVPPLWAQRCGIALMWTFIGPLTLLFMPLGYLLLPQTFRKVRVRRAHLLRVWIYSLAGFAFWWHMAVWLPVSLLLLGVDPSDIYGRGSPRIGMAIVLIPIAWTALWWYRASRSYLRLPTPALVAAVLTSFAFAAAWFVVALLALVDPAIAIDGPRFW